MNETAHGPHNGFITRNYRSIFYPSPTLLPFFKFPPSYVLFILQVARVLKIEREDRVSVSVYIKTSHAILVRQCCTANPPLLSECFDHQKYINSITVLGIAIRVLTSPLHLLSSVKSALPGHSSFTCCVVSPVYIVPGVPKWDGCADTSCSFCCLSPLFIE